MSTLKSKLVRLAYTNTELRPDLLPLLKESSAAETAGLSFRNLLNSATPRSLGEVSRFVGKGGVNVSALSKYLRDIFVGGAGASPRFAAVPAEALASIEEIKKNPEAMKKGESYISKWKKWFVSAPNRRQHYLQQKPRRALLGWAANIASCPVILAAALAPFGPFGLVGGWYLGGIEAIWIARRLAIDVEAAFQEGKALPVEEQPPLVPFLQGWGWS